MKDAFFTVVSPETVLAHLDRFQAMPVETIPLLDCGRRVLGRDITASADIPGFDRAVMDGFAVQAASTFGASEGSPAYFNRVGEVAMGEAPSLAIGPGQAAAVATGGMLPRGADSVVVKEQVRLIDDTLMEVYKPVAPGANMVAADEDFKQGRTVLTAGTMLRAQEIGLLAAMGQTKVPVFQKPRIGIISSGDEIVPADTTPGPGFIRDANTYSLAALTSDAGGLPVPLGISPDDYDALYQKTTAACRECDLILLSGGSSVGSRDFTLDVISALPDSEVLTHGIAIRPGKPTILADVGGKPLWGLPGQVTSAMIVFTVIVKPFLRRIAGLSDPAGREQPLLPAVAGRNIPSANGRTDYIRVSLTETDGQLVANPVFGKSGLFNSMTGADGLVKIDADTEGLDRGAPVAIIPF